MPLMPARDAVAIAFAHLANDVLMRQSLELAATAWKKVPSAWFDKEPDHSRFQAEIALHALCDEQVRREMVAEAEVTLREIPNGVNLLLLRSLIRHGGKDHALALLVNVDPQSRENGLFAIAEELASEGSLLEARNLVAPEIAKWATDVEVPVSPKGASDQLTDKLFTRAAMLYRIGAFDKANELAARGHARRMKQESNAPSTNPAPGFSPFMQKAFRIGDFSGEWGRLDDARIIGYVRSKDWASLVRLRLSVADNPERIVHIDPAIAAEMAK